MIDPDTHRPPPAVRVHVAQHSQGPAVAQVDGVPAAESLATGEQLLAVPRSWGRNPGNGFWDREPWAGRAQGRGQEGEAGTGGVHTGGGGLRGPGQRCGPPRPPSCDGQAQSPCPPHLPGCPHLSPQAPGLPGNIISSFSRIAMEYSRVIQAIDAYYLSN